MCFHGRQISYVASLDIIFFLILEILLWYVYVNYPGTT